MQEVDIIFPFFNNFQLLYAAVSSVIETTSHQRHLVVVDDSVDPNESLNCREFCEKLQLTYIRNEKNLGFLGSVARGVAETSRPYVLLFNSDVRMSGDWGWLETMVENMRDPKVGVVGCKLLFPPELGESVGLTIQHAGVVTDDDGVPYHIFWHRPPDWAPTNVKRKLNAVTGALMLIRREVWDRLGGFDKAYGRGVFEDIDFCWRSRLAGYEVIYEPEVVGYHLQHGSTSPDGSHKLHDHGEENLKTLLARWGKKFAGDYKAIYGSEAEHNLALDKRLQPLWGLREKPVTKMILNFWSKSDNDSREALVSEVMSIARAVTDGEAVPIHTREIIMAEYESNILEELRLKGFSPQQRTQVMSILTKNDKYPEPVTRKRKRH